DGFACLARERRNRLPEVLGNEWDDRMRKTQCGFEDANECSPRAALDRRILGTQLDLRKLDVPIAILVPDEPIECRCRIVEAILGESGLHFRHGPLETADDPLVYEGKLDRGLLVLPAVLAVGIHQHEPRRVPQLVAKVPVPLAAAKVEVERDREAG